MAGGPQGPVYKATCITHRNDQILLGSISRFPPSESSLIKRALLEAGLKKHLRDSFNISDISLPLMAHLRSVAEDWDACGLPPLDELKLPRGVKA